jgi:hypothetical protein
LKMYQLYSFYYHMYSMQPVVVLYLIIYLTNYIYIMIQLIKTLFV